MRPHLLPACASDYNKTMFSPVAVLIYGQIILMASIALCYLTQPGLVRRGVPLSQYGVMRTSRVIFAIGFGLAGLCFATAAARLLNTMPHAGALRTVLLIMAACSIGVVLAPYSARSLYLYCVHILCAWTAFMTQVIGGLWVASYVDGMLTWVLYAAVLAGGVLTLLSIRNLKIVASFAFGQLLAINGSILLMVHTIVRIS